MVGGYSEVAVAVAVAARGREDGEGVRSVVGRCTEEDVWWVSNKEKRLDHVSA